LDVDISVEYESFYFDPIITNQLFDASQSKFLEPKIFVDVAANFDQTLEHTKTKILVDLWPIDGHIWHGYDSELAMLMANLFTYCMPVHFINGPNNLIC